MNTTPSRTPAGSKGLQQVIVKVDRAKYNRFQIRLMKDSKHGEPKKTVTSFIRKAIDDYLKNV